MRTFQCDHCSAPVFFENFRCLNCGSTLGLGPGGSKIYAFHQDSDGHLVTEGGKRLKLCKNSVRYATCNQLLPADDSSPYCRSCQFTEVTPNLSIQSNRKHWSEMEKAKRRLLYSLNHLGIDPVPKTIDAENGLSFRFLVEDGKKIMTGHQNGVITITLAEANDATREARRLALGEDYRTLLGHFRHEVGHYYWDLIIAGGDRLTEFREIFGDETQDYAKALQAHYAKPHDDSWHADYISRYSSAHPWEDWAETFSHYLHMTDVLETAYSVGLLDEDPFAGPHRFDELILLWVPTSYRLNQLGRSIGSGDLYPFVLTEPVVTKMKFIHSVIQDYRQELLRQGQQSQQQQQ